MTETEISALLQMKLLLIALILLKSFWENEDFYAEFNSSGLKKKTENCSQCCFSGILQLILHKVYKEVIELYVHWFIML